MNLANEAHKDGVVVAAVVADPEGEVCDNSCEFANDGICGRQRPSFRRPARPPG